MNIESKVIFGLGSIGCLTAIQLGAWYLGFDGQITIAVTGLITTIIGYVIGKKTVSNT